MASFSTKVVFISGGSRGIGRACATAFGELDATVVIGYANNRAAADETVEQILKGGGKCSALRLDVADSAACAKAIDQLISEHGRLDVLVNNAGIAIDGLALRVKDEDWDLQLNTNLRGAFALARAAARSMIKQRSGAVINIASVVGETGNTGQAAYSASKAGLLGLTKSLARELASRNVRVNAVSPGFIETDMVAKLPPSLREKMLESIPLGRLGRATEVANAVVFLASDAAAYITGEVLRVNGGMYM